MEKSIGALFIIDMAAIVEIEKVLLCTHKNSN